VGCTRLFRCRLAIEDDDFGSLRTIVTSSAYNGSGLFEPNLLDERYLPFEGAGAISEWCLELPDEYRQFDCDAISSGDRAQVVQS